MPLPSIKLKAQRLERIQHPWVFDNEIESGPDGDFSDGALVLAIDSKGKSLGVGFLNRKSRIAFRYLTRNPKEIIDASFWRERVAAAYRYRQERYRGQGGLPIAYRLIHAEADGLPGLIVDVYGQYAVVQILALGLEMWRQQLTDAIFETVGLTGIYERSDSPVRSLEGLEQRNGLIAGEMPAPELELNDNGALLLVDIISGAKTGLFLDQRENQKLAATQAVGKEVLNCFSYTGLFGLECARAQAKKVTDVEVSETFNAINRRQWQRNGLTVEHTIETANVFDHLRELSRQGYQTDMVILDPPAFTKNRASVEAAARGYNEINRVALKLLPPGGVLVTCSCSYHLQEEDFLGVVHKAAIDAKRQLRLIAKRGQPPDHPVLLSAPESAYLKCFIFAVD